MDPFVGEIRMFAFGFAPTGWATCNGQLLPISQNTALFALLGTTYGGNGQSTFALPNLQGSSPIHPGQGAGLSLRDLGESGGSQTVTLLQSEMPLHTHTPRASAGDGTDQTAQNSYFATGIGIGQHAAASNLVSLSGNAVAAAGGSQPHNNMQPYLTVNFNIALQGVFPPRA